jgi:hypothetical protein
VILDRRAMTTDYEALPLLAAGRYLLMVEGRISTSAPTTSRVTVHAPPTVTTAMTLDSIVTGSIGSVGARQVHTFDLAQGAALLIDTLTNRTDLSFSLTGPRGELVASTLRNLDADFRSDAAVILADPGQYRVTITATGRWPRPRRSRSRPRSRPPTIRRIRRASSALTGRRASSSTSITPAARCPGAGRW